MAEYTLDLSALESSDEETQVPKITETNNPVPQDGAASQAAPSATAAAATSAPTKVTPARPTPKKDSKRAREVVPSKGTPEAASKKSKIFKPEWTLSSSSSLCDKGVPLELLRGAMLPKDVAAAKDLSPNALLDNLAGLVVQAGTYVTALDVHKTQERKVRIKLRTEVRDEQEKNAKLQQELDALRSEKEALQVKNRELNEELARTEGALELERRGRAQEFCQVLASPSFQSAVKASVLRLCDKYGEAGFHVGRHKALAKVTDEKTQAEINKLAVDYERIKKVTAKIKFSVPLDGMAILRGHYGEEGGPAPALGEGHQPLISPKLSIIDQLSEHAKGGDLSEDARQSVEAREHNEREIQRRAEARATSTATSTASKQPKP